MRWFQLECNTDTLVKVQQQYRRHAAREPEMRLYRAKTPRDQWRIIFNEPAMIATRYYATDAIERGPPGDGELDPIWPGMGKPSDWTGDAKPRARKRR